MNSIRDSFPNEVVTVPRSCLPCDTMFEKSSGDSHPLQQTPKVAEKPEMAELTKPVYNPMTNPQKPQCVNSDEKARADPSVSRIQQVLRNQLQSVSTQVMEGKQKGVKDNAECKNHPQHQTFVGYASMEIFERQKYISSLKKENLPKMSSGGQSQSQNLESDFDRVNKFIDHANRLVQMFSLKESKDFSVAEVSEIVNIMYEGAIHGYDALKLPKPIVDRLNTLIRQLSDNSKSKKKVSCSVEDMKLRLIYIRFTLSDGASDFDKENKLKAAMVGLQMYPENPEYHSLVSSLYGTITGDATGLNYAKQGLKRFPSHAGLLLLKAAYLVTLQTDCTEDPQLVVDAYENYLQAIPFDHWRVPQTYYIMAYRYLLMAVGQPSKGEHTIKLIQGYYSLGVEAEKNVHPYFHGSEELKSKVAVEQYMTLYERIATQAALCISRIKSRTDKCTTTANRTLPACSGIEKQGKSQTPTTTYDAAFETTVSTTSKPASSATDTPNDDPAVDSNATAPQYIDGLLPEVPLSLHGNLLNLDLIDQLPQHPETGGSPLSMQTVVSMWEERTSPQTFHSVEHIQQCQVVGECVSLPEEKNSEIGAQAEIQDSVLDAEWFETTKRRKLFLPAVSFLRYESVLEEETSPIQESVLEAQSQTQESGLEAESESRIQESVLEETEDNTLPIYEKALPNYNEKAPVLCKTDPPINEGEIEPEPPMRNEGELEPNLQRLPQAVVLPENKFAIAEKLPLYCMAIYCFAQGHFVIAILMILYVLFYLSGPRD